MIRNLVDVEEASPATEPEIFLDGAQKHLARVGFFPEEEGMMQQAEKYFPRQRTKVIEPEGDSPNTTCSAPAHKKTNLHTPTRSRGCQALNGEMKDETSMENCCKVVEVSDLKILDQKHEQKRLKAISWKRDPWGRRIHQWLLSRKIANGGKTFTVGIEPQIIMMISRQ